MLKLPELPLHLPQSRAPIPSECVLKWMGKLQALRKLQPQALQQAAQAQCQRSKQANSLQVADQHRDSKGTRQMSQSRMQTRSLQVAHQHRDSKGTRQMGHSRMQTGSSQVAHQHRDSKGSTPRSRSQKGSHSICLQQAGFWTTCIRAPRKMLCQAFRKRHCQLWPD